MRACDVRGSYPDWEEYFNGPGDYKSLQRIPGIGPARASLVLRIYGSIDAFLQAEPRDVAERTHSLIGPRLTRTLQTRCRAAGLRSDWSVLESVARDELEQESSNPLDRLPERARTWLSRSWKWWEPGHTLVDRAWAGR